MDMIKHIIARINTQMADLTASQRLAIGMCVILIVGSFLWLLQWSGEPDFVRLLEEPMTTAQIAAVRQQLPKGSYKIVGDAIWVHPGDRHELFWDLQNAGALPADTSITFSKLIDDDSPFRPESENHFRRRVALQNELAKVIASSRLISATEVFITDTSDRRINAPNVVPTASIKVTMAAGYALDQGVVRACASLVAGAVPGLLVHNITVVDGATMRPFTIPNPEDAFAQNQLGEKKKYEEHIQKKILEQLSYIPGVRVSVSVQLDATRKRIREIAYAKPAVAEEKTESTETQTGGPSGEAGVGPNVGQSLAGAPAGGRDTSETSSTRFQDQQLAKEVTTQQGAFAVVRTTASIGIPYSYVQGVLTKLNGADPPPTPAQIDKQFESEKTRVSNAVKTIVMAGGDEDVTVDLYPDLAPAMTMLADGTLAVGAGAVAEDKYLALAERYGPQVMLAGLAVVALIMLSRLAKKSFRDAEAQRSRRQAQATQKPEEGDEVFTADVGAVGMATPSHEGTLQAREVDEDLIRAAELTGQVSQLVNEDPSAVANMLRRWTEAST